MSSLVDNPTCPKCNSKRTTPHCTSPTCLWTVCKPCTTALKCAVLVFDVKNRVMHGHTHYER